MYSSHFCFKLHLFRFACALVFTLLFSQSAEAQRFPDERQVTIDLIDVPIDSALLLLSKASGVNIVWDTEDIPQERRVTLLANYLKLGLALDNVFFQTDLIYKQVGNQLTIEKRYVPLISEMVTISGRVVDQRSGEMLPNAYVITDDVVYVENTNDFGFYSMTVPRDQTYNLAISYLGYKTHTTTITPVDNIDLDFILEPYNLLNEIVIVSEVPKKSKESEQFDQMPLDLLGALPGLAGESDVLRLAQMRAGVSSQADGFGGMLVRGGSVDQNLVLLDGVPVYNTGHAFGLFSVFNSSAIKSAKLIKGGIPARFGGRLSSVFDIQTKDGNNQSLHGDFSISPLMAKATIEGPISKGKSSFLLTGRRTIVDPWLKPFSKYQFERNNQEGFINFFFYDLNAKLNFNLGDKDQIFLSAYTGKDRYFNEVSGSTDAGFDRVVEEFDQTDLDWGNEIATLRWTHEFGSKVFGQASFSFTRFKFQNFDFDRTKITNPTTNTETLDYASKFFISDISDQIASYQLDWFASKSYFLKMGVNYTNHNIVPGVDFGNRFNRNLVDSVITPQSIRDSTSYSAINGQELRFFVENEFRVGKQLVFNLGGHLSRISTTGKTFTSIQPRLSAKFNLGLNTNIKLGYTQMDQYFHLLSGGGLGLPNEVWLPSTNQLAPERSRQFSAGFEHRFGDQWNLSLSAYDKKFDGVIGFTEGGLFDIKEGVEWESTIPIGTGTARGVEFEIEKLMGAVRGWISYTYGNSRRSYVELNDGQAFRAIGDRQHMFNINTLVRLNDNIELGLSWIYGSPAPLTTPTQKQPILIDGEIVFVPVFGNVHNAELPAYHKLDANVNVYNKYDWGQQKLSIGVYNTYGRRNPYYIDILQEANDFRLEQLSLIPFLPYVSLSVSF